MGRLSRLPAALPSLSFDALIDYANPNMRTIPVQDGFSPSWEVGLTLSWSPNDVLLGDHGASASRARATAARAGSAASSGAWAQHAFVDPDDPQNPYRSITTFVDSPYNQRCFNDGYHLGHHLKPSRHWLEMPADFEAHRARIAAEGGIVFRKIDYFVIWFLLMIKSYRTPARFWVHVGDGPPPSIDERVVIMRARVQRIG